MGSSTPTTLRALSLVAVTSVVASLFFGVASPAMADTVPPGALPATASTDSLPTAQVNGVVWSQVVIGDVVYAGGEFTQAQPAGAPAGSGTVARSNLVAYNLITGVLLSTFAPTVNAQVRDLAASPDGTRLYVAGDFTTINGTTRSRIAALNPSTGAVIAGFAPSANATVYSVTATNSTVWFGGIFTSVTGTARTRAAAASASTGALTAFNPSIPDYTVRGVEVSPDASSVVLAGSFSNLNGPADTAGTLAGAQHGMGMVNATTGASLTWKANQTVSNYGAQAAIWSLSSDADGVYGTGYYLQGLGRGTLEGAFNASWSDGTIKWLTDCHGDSYSVAASADVVYVAGHSHYCYNLGAFPQTSPNIYQRGTAYTKVATGTLTNNTVVQPAYVNLVGNPAPTQLTFYPDINSGTYTGQNQGAWNVATSGKYVLYAGEFTEINGVRQTGLARFATSDIAPNDDGPLLSGANFVPSVEAIQSGTVRISWLANEDRDNQNLVYQVIRDSTVIATINSASRLWFDRPTLTYTDTGLANGSSQSYRIRATDPFGNTVLGDPVSVVVSATDSTSSYADTVLADGATDYWRFNSAIGTTIPDLAGVRDITINSGVTLGSQGAIGGDTDGSATFSGDSSGTAATKTWIPGTNNFSVEAWFRTTSTSGGKIIGFGNSSAGLSRTHDRDVFLDASGKVYYTVNQGTEKVISSPSSGYNDGQWHAVVATMSSAGQRLYVDGNLVASDATSVLAQGVGAYWRIGGDTVTNATVNADAYFDGQIDEVAVYDAAITAATISGHYTLGSAGASSSAPLATATVAMTDLTAAFDGTKSSDPNGSIVSYNWNFGDGTTGTGATVSHTYTAAGSYVAKLTVTDNSGLSTTTSVMATPIAATDIARDSFSRGATAGLGTADKGGTWQVVSGAAATGVQDGRAQFDMAAGITTNAYLGAISSSDSDVTVQTSVLDDLSGSGATFNLYGRRISVRTPPGGVPQFNGDYRLKTVINAAGAVTVTLQRAVVDTSVVPNTTTVSSLGAASTIAGLTYHVGDVLNTRFQVTGVNPTTLRAKVWRVGTSEPAAWQVTSTDTLAGLQNPGHVGFGAYLPSSATTTPLPFTWDNLVVVATDTSNTAPTASFTTAVTNLSAAFTSTSTDNGTITAYAWNFGDGQTANIANPTHPYAAAGTYPVTLTVTDNAGATGAITQNVTVSTGGPVNAAPTASFTATPTDLTVAVDARASSDSDGTISSYAWNFGDGSTGTGVTASHPYALAGTYTVTLTVTDNGSATGTTTRSVTVIAPPPTGTTFAADAFGRTTAGALGNADTGGAWTVSGGAANFSVSGGLGRLSTPAGATLNAYLGSTSTTDADITTAVSLLQQSTGGGIYANVIGRRIGTANYQTRVQVSSAGAVTVQLQRSGTTLVSVKPAGLTYAVGDHLNVRLQVTGTSPTTIQAKVWKVGSTEPTAWQASTTDSTAGLQAAGSIGIGSYLSSSATNNPTVVTFDNLLAQASGGVTPPTNIAPTASFTAAVSTLTVSVDATASTDSDGTISSYAWAFGDGTTGNGVTTSHPYAAAGTYTVTLTVTDNGGATATTIRSVTVSTTPPPVGANFATDAFARSVTGGLGTADLGGAWTVSGGATNYSVTGGVARLSTPVAAELNAYLGATSVTSADITATVALPALPTGGGTYATVIGRRIGTANYRTRVQISSAGVVTLQVQRSGTTIGSVQPAGLTYAVGDQLNVRFQVFGTSPTTLQAKVWKVGTAEPAAWQVTTTDTTAALQAAGSIGIGNYTSGSATSAVVVNFDNLAAKPVE